MLALIIMGEHLPKGTVIFKNWSKLWQNKLVSSCRQMLAHNNRGEHLPQTTDILFKKLVFWEVFGDFGNFRPVNLPKTGNILKELLLVLGKCFPYNKHLSICIKLVSFSEICPSVNSKNVTGFRQKLFEGSFLQLILNCKFDLIGPICFEKSVKKVLRRGVRVRKGNQFNANAQMLIIWKAFA